MGGARGGGGRTRRGSGAGRLKNLTAAMNRRLKHPNDGAELAFMAMSRKNRVKGEKNATVRSEYLPF